MRSRIIIAVFVVVGVVGLALLARGGDHHQSITVEPVVPTTETPTAPTSQQLVVMRNGHLQVLTDGGEFVRELRDLTTSAGLSSAWVSTDGKDVYYTVSPADADTRRGAALFRVPFAGGDSTQVGTGRLPTVSPDGRQLAYVTVGADDQPTLVLRRVSDGTERTIAAPPASASQPPVIDAIAWSHDGTRLAVAYSWGELLEQRAMVVLDPGVAKSLADGIDVQRSVDRSWRGSPSFLPDGNLLAVDACCTGNETAEFQRAAVVSVNSVDGSLLRTVATTESDRHTVATGASSDGVDVTWIVGETLMRSVNGEPATPLGDGFQVAVWTP